MGLKSGLPENMLRKTILVNPDEGIEKAKLNRYIKGIVANP